MKSLFETYKMKYEPPVFWRRSGGYVAAIRASQWDFIDFAAN
jgi:hypothetical protein